MIKVPWLRRSSSAGVRKEERRPALRKEAVIKDEVCATVEERPFKGRVQAPRSVGALAPAVLRDVNFAGGEEKRYFAPKRYDEAGPRTLPRC